MMEYKRKKIDDYEVFEVKGDFVIGQKGDLSQEYTELLKDGKYKFVFDLTRVRVIDSSGLGTLIMGISNITDHNTKLKVCIDMDNESVRNIFDYIRIDKVIAFYPNVQDAINDQNEIKFSR
jgi:anti-sigma B factor antagonist